MGGKFQKMRFKAIYFMNLASLTNKLKEVSRYGPQLYRINVLQDFLTNYLALVLLGVFNQKKMKIFSTANLIGTLRGSATPCNPAN